MFDMMRVVVAAAGEDDSEEDAEQNLKEMESLLKAILCKMEGLAVCWCSLRET